ncbi:MAG: hypothetical protein HY985_12165 [Magnetospirillum sp.]|nr:hypothetical protein [Magnetospirillum sp.]
MGDKPAATPPPPPPSPPEPVDPIDQAGEDSFPASDPPSTSPVTHTGQPRPGPVRPPQ